MTKLVCISDTHCQLEKFDLPEGDILVHAGDLTYSGNFKEINNELIKLGEKGKNFKNIVLVAGNHDRLFQNEPTLARQLCVDNGITYLEDSSVTIENLNIFGSPWQPFFCNWSFNLPRGEALKEKWAMIPENTNILVTHGPPYGFLDSVEKFNGKNCEWEFQHLGCEELANRVFELNELKHHIFGHIHEGYGIFNAHGPSFVNASICTSQYRPTNKPIEIEIKTE